MSNLVSGELKVHRIILLLFAGFMIGQTWVEGIEVTTGGKELTLRIGGLIHVQSDFGDRGDPRFTTDNDRIYLRRTRLNVSGDFLEDFDFKVEMDLTGSLGNNIQTSSDLRAQLTDGYINWNKYERANIRGGQFKTGYGYEQLYSDAKLKTIERSLPNDRLTIGRQMGAQISGDFYEKRFSYAAGVYNGTGVNNIANDNDSFMVTGRIAAIPYRNESQTEISWAVGTNVYHSTDQDLTLPSDIGLLDNEFTGERLGYGVDSQFRYGPVELWVEYLHLDLDTEDTKTTFTLDGWYLQASYILVPNKLSVLAKYETFDPGTGVSGNETDTWTFGIAYFFKGDDICFRINYLRSEVPALETQDKVLLRMQVAF
jgi:phosphate-selective porin OprO/OprP